LQVAHLTNLLSSFIPHFFFGGQQAISYGRLVANILAALSLIAGCGLSCIALYSYLTPYWGEALALSALCLILFAISFILYGVGYFLKPKEHPPLEIMPKLEEALNQFPSYDLIKKACSVLPPKALIGLFATVAVIAYVANSGKKNA
jgi:hypothetical protein